MDPHIIILQLEILACFVLPWTSTLLTECIAGSYGSNCSETCSPTCAAGTTCDPVNGYCLDGCKSGYTGDFCQYICPDGTFGDRCRFTCSQNCQNPVCDKFSDIGMCLNISCKAGFKGETCSKVCEAGEYGKNCVNNCSGNCMFNDGCSRFNGSCPSGCHLGYFGERCDQEQDRAPNVVTPIVLAVAVCTFLTIAAMVIIAAIFGLKLRPSTASNNPDSNSTPETGTENDPDIYENPAGAFTRQRVRQQGNHQIVDYENIVVNVYETPEAVERV